MLEIYLANSIRMPIEYQQLGWFGINSLESEEMTIENKIL